MPDQVPAEVVRERYERLVACVEEVTWAEHRTQLGRTVEVLVAAGEGRKDAATARMSGRARDGRLVHFAVGAADIRPGDIVTTTVTRAAPHFLVADVPVLSHRRTRAGDAHAAGLRPVTGGASVTGVGLGMPAIGAPPVVATTSGCAL
jgi:tRNA-2-methylthio-N6-dimethylallyladenosine synthase